MRVFNSMTKMDDSIDLFLAHDEGEFGKRAKKDAAVATHILAEFRRYKRRYGSPRITRALKAAGQRVGRHRVARIMRENRLKAQRETAFL